MTKNKLFVIGSVSLILILLGIGTGAIGFKPETLRSFFQKNGVIRIGGTNTGPTTPSPTNVKVVSEESITIEIVKKVSPAVVTIGVTKFQPVFSQPDFGFDPFGSFFIPPQQQGTTKIKQDIGSGFIVRADGLIITNKHVVGDAQAKYRVITSDDKSFDVVKIYRDPENDLAILKIGATNLPVVEMGDSSQLQVGQFALAIGTALGEFRSTVTTGVVSGLGRGITAGSPFEGSEKLSNVIQTSAAINPGNSGGPLLNSLGQVIGVNVAVASNAQNIGFALPIDLLKESLKTFDANGQFAPRAFLGVEYRMVTRDLAILNEIPEGAYVQGVVANGPADAAGVGQGDIITKIDGQAVRDAGGGLAAIVSKKKVGDIVELMIYGSDSKTRTVKAILKENLQ